MITEADLAHLKHCVSLAREALANGDQPFGSILIGASGALLFKDYNRVGGGDHTQHPEFAIARWAANALTPEERAQATVYTSGEPCTMCAAAHGWVGLGRIVYASSAEQLTEWLTELGVAPSRVRPLPVTDVIADTQVDGPVAELADELRGLHAEYYAGR